ncbi:hypothetical protein ALP75_205169 [Pseudomonas syringae pv. actinidiae]|nr:hypothetical protein ALP75_205169 [Pseudomonas syringae pv. actinidiae]
MTSTGTGTVSHSLARPSARNPALKLPLASSPLGKVMPTAIERPPVGISCTPMIRNMLPSVARMSGMPMRTMRKPLNSPTSAPQARLMKIAASGPQSSTTIT